MALSGASWLKSQFDHRLRASRLRRPSRSQIYRHDPHFLDQLSRKWHTAKYRFKSVFTKDHASQELSGTPQQLASTERFDSDLSSEVSWAEIDAEEWPIQHDRFDRWHEMERNVSSLNGSARTLSPSVLWSEEHVWRADQSKTPRDFSFSPASSDESLRDGNGNKLRKSFSQLRTSIGKRSQPPSSKHTKSTSKTLRSNGNDLPTSQNDIECEAKLCAVCCGIRADRIAAGYQHHYLKDLVVSAESCRFCAFLRHHVLAYYHPHSFTSYRYRLMLKQTFAQVMDTKGKRDPMGWGLNYFTNEGDPATEFDVPWRRTLTNTGSDESFDVGRTWLADCLAGQGEHVTKHHVTPPEPQEAHRLSPELPSRLIDIGSSGLDEAHVVLTSTESCSYRYLALSYCWGDVANPPWITTKTNLAQRLTSFDYRDLPATLSDALVITRKLGFRYIWIDALCIVQDDGDDWAIEGARMAGIYRGAALTIAVPSSDSVLLGAFNKQSTSHLEDYTRMIRLDSYMDDMKKSSLYFYRELVKSPRLRHVNAGPLSTRAWCLQERLLSPRILYYTASQLLWQCTHCNKNEDRLEKPYVDRSKVEERPSYLTYGTGRNPFDVEFPLEYSWPMTRDEISYWWYHVLVPKYTHRHLTYGWDKLPAISGLARALSLYRSSEYLAGIWRESLLRGLFWKRNGPGKKSSVYRSPSWSWASQDSAVAYARADDEGIDRNTTGYSKFGTSIRAASVVANQHDPFGQVSSGSIELSVVLIPGWVMQTTWAQTSSLKNPRQEKCVIGIIWNNMKPYVLRADMDDDDLVSKEVVYAYLGLYYLIIEHVSESDRVYRRIGLARADAYPATLLKAPQTLITLI
ncbi:heterokaryon incompatibility protein-domain-containing protein [Xylariaceae sp. FL1019]|nr:heterokaryon incompatibility protein-domain-containing protein [Xylariaceae sp. FL1019]